MRLSVALCVSIPMLMAQTERPAGSVTAVRHWRLQDVTRVVIEVSREFQFRSDRLQDPERVYFDILNSRPRIESRRFYSEAVEDELLKKIRVAETAPGTTRIVLELGSDVEATTSQLTNPDRLIIELRHPNVTAIPAARPALPPSAAPAEPPSATHRTAGPPVAPPVAKADVQKPVLPKPEPAVSLRIPARPPINTEFLAPPPVAPRPEIARAPVPEPARPAVVAERPVAAASHLPAEVGKAARRTASGDTSLVRALGLKITRVVIDPGHGGHDEGTHGPKGLLEKDVVLDIATRVGKLITARMGAEVIYTRSDDTFIPLEGRTALANEKKADLFLSIHANSSPIARTAGVETYYLNFTDSKEALDVASRENASSQKSIFELQDVIQKITLHEKLGESKEFAARMQASLYSFSRRNFPNTRNRGVKKAPFVVLIGANMPSVLAEIGFLSNPREEALLKRPDYRERLAEAIFRGISHYSDSLSHVQVASAQP
jgi:N-acetylmuramoyl-L-alanine amidase